MSLQPTTPRRESLLIFGRSNSGRSSTWVNWADWAARTNADIHFHVGITDRSWDAIRFDEIEPYVTATELDHDDLMAWVEWANKLKTEVKRSDVAVFDRTDTLWEVAQDFYWKKKLGNDNNLLADVFFENEKAIESKNQEGKLMGGSHGSHWDLIKRYYRAVLTPFVNLPCHKVFICDTKEIRQDMEECESLKAQWKVGWMPAGEKHLPEFALTWLYCAETPRGHVYTTVRDKAALGQPKRTELKGQAVENGFVLDYLIPVANWSL